MICSRCGLKGIGSDSTLRIDGNGRYIIQVIKVLLVVLLIFPVKILCFENTFKPRVIVLLGLRYLEVLKTRLRQTTMWRANQQVKAISLFSSKEFSYEKVT